jgi:hypothetical protein
MQSVTLFRLHAALRAVCPIAGVAGEPGAVRVDYQPEATEQEQAAAAAALAAFDFAAEADDAWLENENPERKTLRQLAATAIADNDAFLALATPTNAQVLAQVKRLTQQNTRVLKRIIQID